MENQPSDYEKERDRLLAIGDAARENPEGAEKPEEKPDEPKGVDPNDLLEDEPEDPEEKPAPVEKPDLEEKPDPAEKPADEFKLENEGDDYQDYQLTFQGQQISKRFNKEGLKAELQKAHNYDAKMKQIEPYINLSNLIIKNKELGDAVRHYVEHGKLPAQKTEGFKFKSLSEFSADDPQAGDKWFQENMDSFKEAIISELGQKKPEVVEQPEKSNVVQFKIGGADVPMLAQDAVVMSNLQGRDPDNFVKVLGVMQGMIPKLSQAQREQIGRETEAGDYTNLYKMYDHAKAQIIKPELPEKKRDFRMKSSGATQKAGNSKDPWAVSPKEFRKVVSKLANS